MKIYKCFQVILYFAILVTSIAAECNVCQDNQAACINSTSYYLCFGENTPHTNTLYHCKDGFDCTNLNAICVQASASRPPSCGDTSQCGLCSAHRNNLFACLSRNTFQMCYGALRPTGQIGYCPSSYVCDADNDSVCVNPAEANSVTCDVVANDSTVTERTTTPETTEATSTPTYPMSPDDVCGQMREVGLFPTMPTDPFCKRYIYCYYHNGIINGMEYTCSAGSYFKIETVQCTFVKPSYCL